MKKMNKKGFTIVELVIVIAVIAILAAVMIPTFSNVVTKAQESAAVQEVRSAYTSTLSKDLSEDGEDVVNGKGDIVVKATNGKLVNISANGEVKIAESTVTEYGYEVDATTKLIKVKAA